MTMRNLSLALIAVFFSLPTYAQSVLYTDSSTGRVGVGTATPSTTFEVNGTATATTFSGSGTSLTNVPATSLTGNLQISNFDGGTGASSSTYWRGDGTWVTPPSGPSGAMVLLATVNASGASSVTFNSTYITGTYNKYVIEYDSMANGTSGAVFGLQVSTDNGSTLKTTNYLNSNSASTSVVEICPGFLTTFTGSPPLIQGTIKFSVPSASSYTMFSAQCGGIKGGASVTAVDEKFNTGGYTGAASAINYIKISTDTGTITGNFHLYGLQGT